MPWFSGFPLQAEDVCKFWQALCRLWWALCRLFQTRTSQKQGWEGIMSASTLRWGRRKSQGIRCHGRKAPSFWHFGSSQAQFWCYDLFIFPCSLYGSKRNLLVGPLAGGLRRGPQRAREEPKACWLPQAIALTPKPRPTAHPGALYQSILATSLPSSCNQQVSERHQAINPLPSAINPQVWGDWESVNSPLSNSLFFPGSWRV